MEARGRSICGRPLRTANATPARHVVLTLKILRREGMTHVFMTPLEFVQRLAAAPKRVSSATAVLFWSA